ncbi:amidohydrolase family protein [Solimicrobium silvestre]|uniref:Amidohydrolase n=1 Tax=Solimicrobium silvestre TaxID=2099400 RepID=A0A2S9GYP2_9BURK|nr:amidohydrolase family protein [Solimicrobium silvestre]PRC92845.1 Amidohydrolase [Solimicrobium silvestre]
MKSKVMAIAMLSVMSAYAANAAETTRYTIILDNGTVAGKQIVDSNDKGDVKVHFTFKDNGRGPDLDENIHLAPDGTMSKYEVKGASTFGAVVDDHFTQTGSQAEWHSTSEHGSKKVDGPATSSAFYLPMNSSYEVASLGITALSKRKDNNLPLLPSGNLSQHKVDDMVVKLGGKSQHVQLLAQTGIGFNPQFYWATTGKSPRLFAAIAPGYATLIEDGWQSNTAELTKHQSLASDKLLKELATRTQHAMTGLTVIRNARVFDSETAQLGAASDVYVLRGKITQVLAAGSPVAGADNEIDAAGRVLLPGLFDMHGHVDRWSGGLNLAAGVTSVRDMGNSNAEMQKMIDEIAADQLLSPQLVPSGFLEGNSPYAAQMGFVIKDLKEAKHAVDWYSEHGYPQLKIYNSFPHEDVKEIVAYAHSHGMRVSGHVPVFMRAQEVVEQGFDEIQHINQVLLNFLVTPTTDTRTLDRFYLPAEKVADLDFDSKEVQDFIALLQAHHTVIDSTLSTFDFIKQRDGDMAEPYAAIADHMPPDVKRSFSVGQMKIPDDATAKRYLASYNKMVEFVGRMYRAGIPLVAGTDALSGFTLQSELELYVKAGLTPAQALQVATRNGARYTRTTNERGSITAGKLADLVLVDGDPTMNIGDIRKVALVITRGKLIYPHEIDKELGIQPFVQNPPMMKALAPTSSSIATSGVGGVAPQMGRFGMDAKD